MLIKHVRRALPLLGSAVLIAVCGCAPAYHAYPGLCIPYTYCPQPPLPYATYPKCHCPTPVTSRYLESNVGSKEETQPFSLGY